MEIIVHKMSLFGCSYKHKALYKCTKERFILHGCTREHETKILTCVDSVVINDGG